MAEPFLGEIRLMGFGFPPKGWAHCNGQILPINTNAALFSLLGTTYGGDGRVNFALPDLRARVPIHMGAGHTLGERGGANTHTLTAVELPTHTHVLNVSTAANGGNVSPANRFLGGGNNVYHAPAAFTALHPLTVAAVGAGQPHENRQPYLTINFCIALAGIFPSQN
jgi:microcystin-dependent protein